MHIGIGVRSYESQAVGFRFTLLPCKAGALPAELIPRDNKEAVMRNGNRSSLFVIATSVFFESKVLWRIA